MPQLIQKIEKEHEIPSGLLAAIASVESGLKPYAIGVSGKSVKASSKEEAKQIIKQYLAKGITNIDIGIMQINWRWHAKDINNIALINLDNNVIIFSNVVAGSGVRYAAQQYIWHTKIDYGILSDEISNTNLVCHQQKLKTNK